MENENKKIRNQVNRMNFEQEKMMKKEKLN